MTLVAPRAVCAIYGDRRRRHACGERRARMFHMKTDLAARPGHAANDIELGRPRAAFPNARVAVLGDVILDRYVTGHCAPPVARGADPGAAARRQSQHAGRRGERRAEHRDARRPDDADRRRRRRCGRRRNDPPGGGGRRHRLPACRRRRAADHRQDPLHGRIASAPAARRRNHRAAGGGHRQRRAGAVRRRRSTGPMSSCCPTMPRACWATRCWPPSLARAAGARHAWWSPIRSGPISRPIAAPPS